MKGKTDKAKGRLTAGALTGNKKLQREGGAQATKGKVKEKVDRGVAKIQEPSKGGRGEAIPRLAW